MSHDTELIPVAAALLTTLADRLENRIKTMGPAGFNESTGGLAFDVAAAARDAAAMVESGHVLSPADVEFVVGRLGLAMVVDSALQTWGTE